MSPGPGSRLDKAAPARWPAPPTRIATRTCNSTMAGSPPSPRQRSGASSTGPVAVHRFDSTGEAYDAAQRLDELQDGDVLWVPSEGVAGVLVQTWPVAVNEPHDRRYGEFEGYVGGPDALAAAAGGRYADTWKGPGSSSRAVQARMPRSGRGRPRIPAGRAASAMAEGPRSRPGCGNHAPGPGCRAPLGAAARTRCYLTVAPVRAAGSAGGRQGWPCPPSPGRRWPGGTAFSSACLDVAARRYACRACRPPRAPRCPLPAA